VTDRAERGDGTRLIDNLMIDHTRLQQIDLIAPPSQIGPLFGVSHSAAHRVIDTVGPLLALAPVRKRRVDSVAIVDGTLVPTRDHRLAAPARTTATPRTCRSRSTRTPAWSSPPVIRNPATALSHSR
jgi:hypothetical protein